MNRARTLFLCLSLFSLALPFGHARQNKQQKKQNAINQAHTAEIEAAKKSAADWLVLIDAGKYAESWKESAAFLQKNFPEADWVKHLNQIRKPLDPFIERTLSTTEFRDQLPGLPPGEYVALVWESYFGAKHQMLESVVVSLDDGQWKPVGYAVQ